MFRCLSNLSISLLIGLYLSAAQRPAASAGDRGYLFTYESVDEETLGQIVEYLDLDRDQAAIARDLALSERYSERVAKLHVETVKKIGDAGVAEHNQLIDEAQEEWSKQLRGGHPKGSPLRIVGEHTPPLPSYPRENLAAVADRSLAEDAERASEIRRWIREQIESASNGLFPGNDAYMVRWRSEDRYLPTESELAQMAENTNTANAAPILSYYRHRLDGAPPFPVLYTLYWYSDDLWRVCWDLSKSRSRLPYVDFCTTPTATWKLTDSWLVYMDPNRPWPRGHSLAHVRKAFELDVGFLLTGGFSYAAELGVRLVDITIHGDRWTAKFSDRDIVAILIEGVWDQTRNRGFVTAFSMTRADDELQFAPSEYVMANWRYVPSAAIWFVAEVRAFLHDNRLDRILNVEALTPLPDDVMAKIVKTPDFDTYDAIRGQMNLRSKTDYTGSHVYNHVLTPEGVRTVDLGAYIVEDDSMQLRIAGWTLSGLVAVAALVARVVQSCVHTSAERRLQ